MIEREEHHDWDACVQLIQTRKDEATGRLLSRHEKTSMNKITLTEESYARLVSSIIFESDRGSAIILHAYLDHILRSFIEKRILKGFRIPSDFTRRVQLAYSIGLLTEDEKGLLLGINEIRREFAHSISLIAFSDPIVDVLCNKLKPLPFFFPSIEAWEQEPQRKKYEYVALNLTFALFFRSVEQITEWSPKGSSI